MDSGSSARAVSAGRLQLGQFVLDLNARELMTSDNQVAGLRRQALNVLLVLGARASQVVTKEELMHLVWPRVVVGEGSITQAMSDIRRVLGDDSHRLVRTVARRGYVLIPEAVLDPVSEATPAPQPQSSSDSQSNSQSNPQSHSQSHSQPPSQSPSQSPSSAARRWGFAAAGAWALAAGFTAWTASGGFTLARHGPPAAANDPVPVQSQANSIVVLPLALEGDMTDAGWFADALLGDLILEVGRIGDSLVISRETAQTYKGKDPDPRTVARELGVRHVVRGRLRTGADAIHLQMALIDGDTGVQRWSEKFVIERARLDEALNEFVLQLARFLQVEVVRSAGTRVARLSPEAVSADDLAMRGRAIYYRGFNGHNLREALELFERAVAMDPDSRAWGGIAVMSNLGAVNGWLPDSRAALRRLEEASANLDRINPDGFSAMQARTMVASHGKDAASWLRRSEAWAERYRQPVALGSHGFALALNGRPEEALAPLELALRLSPRDVFRAEWQYRLALAHFLAGDYQQARRWGHAAQVANPALPWPPVHAAASVQLGLIEEGRRILDDLLTRQVNYDAARIVERLDGDDPRFLQGRDRLITSLREVGLR